MASVFDIIGKAENRAMEFELAFPSDEPKMLITVKRMPEVFLNNALLAADGELRKRAVEPTNPIFLSLYNDQYAYETVEYLKTHATGWKAADGSELKEKFSPPEFAKWVDELDLGQRRRLGYAYLIAAQEDEKKTTPGASGGQASSTPSKNDSATT